MVDKQSAFCFYICRLIIFLKAQGYQVTFGEAWRSPETCELYEKTGKGIANSNHTQRLAIDLNLFKEGRFLQKTSEYEEAGKYWESLSDGFYKCCWGGNFKTSDADHFSFEHLGVR